jgi:hypothetical protein
MLRLTLSVVCVGLSLLLPPAVATATLGHASLHAFAAQASATETVYVTRTGEKYHRQSCRYLANSSIPMALGEASRRYGACKVCKPPVLGTGSTPTPLVEPTKPTKSAPVVSTMQRQQCAATTKKGTRCSRTAKPGSAYCWQHGG